MKIWQTMKRWSARITALSLLTCAVGMAPVAAFAGPYLAMGYWIYEGETEPSEVTLAFPWLWVVPFLLAGGALLVADIKTGDARYRWGGIGCAVLALVIEGTHAMDLIVMSAP